MYCYPERITDELLDVIANEEKMVKYIDLPLQHCSRSVLRRMNRRGSREELTALLKKIREKVPGVTLRTTVMTGFPGESEEDFTELAEFVKEIRFDRLGCFAYSAEEGTPAAEYPDQVPEDIRIKRQENIMELQARIMEENCIQSEGREISVMVEGYDRYAGSFFGRSAADAPEVDSTVFFTAKTRSLNAGEFVTVRVTDHLDCDLLGEMISRES